jgi:tetratricopeptide (TPR) repeat protein
MGRSQDVPRRSWIGLLTVWPGLAQVWTGQEILGLILAALFATSLNLAIVARWIWSEAFATGWSEIFASLALLTWLASFAYTIWWVWLCHPERHRREIERLFRDAMEAYLQGRWNDSRKRIERILAMDETDADALLHLGTVYVRLQQPSMARRAFRQCLEQEGGAKWKWEIQQALKQLDNA